MVEHFREKAMNTRPITPHGRGVRGLNLSRSSILFGGAFGRIFRALPPADFGVDDAASMANLKLLGQAMVTTLDLPKDGPDDEESGIPALYTYLGQFIDHDLTFDPASSLQQQDDPDGLVDYRTPRFDLDNVYGRGPDDQPYLYNHPKNGPATFILGNRLAAGGPINPDANDLPRSQPQSGNERAIIGDPRNDENSIVSQFQSLFLKFHNRFVTDALKDNSKIDFQTVQQEVRFHYQWLLIHDFLPTIINAETYNSVFPHVAKGGSIADNHPQLRFYHPKNEPFMPLEFSVAAYRFGHSMVRPGYRLNDVPKNLHPIFPIDNPKFPESLRGFRRPPAEDWGIDWARFIDIEPRPYGVKLDDNGKVNGQDPTPQQLSDNKQRLQLAYRIDTSLVFPLGRLPDDVADPVNPSLAERNLLRGWRLRLPNGQDVARAMGEEVLKDEEIIIGKFTDDKDPNAKTILDVSPEFADNCPLWTYCLAETAKHTVKGRHGVTSKVLGKVGGRIVAETFAGILAYDSQSFLNQNPRWTPNPRFKGTFGLKELVNYALGR